MIKTQKFGVEIEMTGITREKAAQVTAAFFTEKFGGYFQAKYLGTHYKAWSVRDNKGRAWKYVYDASILPQFKQYGEIRLAGNEHKCELVTPVLEYEDIEILQELIRRLRKAGAFVNAKCGVHIHVDASNHNAQTIRNLVNIVGSKEDMIYRALKVDEDRAKNYCKKINQKFQDAINASRPQDLDAIANYWYEGNTGQAMQHYSVTRYHGLNLHNIWYRGTIEFRWFNGTLHAGEIKAYIQFCLAISAQALTQKTASARKTTSDNEKYTFRTWLLRLGLIGDEFKTCRLHLLKHLEGCAAWRNPQRAAA